MQGYDVEAFDAQPSIVKATEEYASGSTRLMAFEDFNWDKKVGGIWACASLLHVRPEMLPEVLSRLIEALNPRGVIYFSFKYRAQQRAVNGRYFNDLQEAVISDVVVTVGSRLIYTWAADDVRAGLDGERWLNALIRGRQWSD